MTLKSYRPTTALLVGLILGLGMLIGLLLAAYITYAFVPAGWILHDAPPHLLKFDPSSESVQYRDLYVSRVANRFKRQENNTVEGLREALIALGIASGDTRLEEAIEMVRSAELAARKENSRPIEMGQPEAGFFTTADELNLSALLQNLEQLRSNESLLQELTSDLPAPTSQTIRERLRQPLFVALFVAAAACVLLSAILLSQSVLERTVQPLEASGAAYATGQFSAASPAVAPTDIPTTAYAPTPATDFYPTAGQPPTPSQAPQPVITSAPFGEAPFQTFSAKYSEGIDDFDESKDLYTAEGELLGECGVSIAERYGLGNSSCPVAFVVWVFDKADMSSETRILLTPFAASHQAIRHKLEARGTLIELKSDRLQFEIVTSTMHVEVRVSGVEFKRLDATPLDGVRKAEFHFSAFLKPKSG
ncbi:MAG: hypothetical protein ACK4WM_04490 [Thermoflexales bacterium]